MGFLVKNVIISDKNVYCKETGTSEPPRGIPQSSESRFAGGSITLYITNGGPDEPKERPGFINIENPDLEWKDLEKPPQFATCFVVTGECKANNEVVIQMSNIEVGGGLFISPTTVNVQVGGD